MEKQNKYYSAKLNWLRDDVAHVNSDTWAVASQVNNLQIPAGLTLFEAAQIYLAHQRIMRAIDNFGKYCSVLDKAWDNQE